MDDVARRGLAALFAMTGLMPAASCAPRYGHLPPIAPAELWAPLPVQHVAVDGIDVAYIDSDPTATDKPTLLLIHGLSSWIGFWEHQVPAFSGQYRVIALDLPGYGASAKPDAPYSPPWYADVVVGLADALGLSSVVLVGHSMGGQIALTIALDHPDRVSALVLSAPAGIETFHPGQAALLKGFVNERRTFQTPEEDLRHAFSLAFGRMDEGAERLLQERVRMKGTEALQGTSVAVSRSVAGMLDHPVRPRLLELTVPTLIVFGAEDQMIPNPVLHGGRTKTVAEAGRNAIKGSELVMIQGAGHTVHHDAPEVFNRAVVDFLGRRLAH